MRPVFKVVALTLLGIALLLLGIGMLLPHHWDVERKILIHSPASEIHRVIADLHNWPKWAGWSADDATVQYEVSEANSGVGATLSFRGQRAGYGRVRITKSTPNEGIGFESAVNSDTFSGKSSLVLAPSEGSTLVTWRDQGRLPPVIGGFLLDSVQQRLTIHLEGGLQRLKTLVEGPQPGEPRPTGTAPRP